MAPVTGGMAVEFVLESAATRTVMLAAALTATGVLLRYLWRAVKMGETAFVQLVGTAGQPSLRQMQEKQDEALTTLAFEVRAVKKELHPNTGSSMRDHLFEEIRKVQHDVTNVRAGQEMMLGLVDNSTNAAARAAQRAEDTARQVENVSESARLERAQIVTAMGRMREEIASDGAHRYAEALDLLAEHGGPDLRPHVNVAPHAHVLPTAEAPSLTGGPVEPPEET